MVTFTAVIEYLGAFLISIAFLPQTIKTLRTKNTKGLSLTWLLIYHLGLTLFIIYASFISAYGLLAANAFGWIVNSILLLLIIANILQNKKLAKATKTNPKKANSAKRNSSNIKKENFKTS